MGHGLPTQGCVVQRQGLFTQPQGARRGCAAIGTPAVEGPPASNEQRAVAMVKRHALVWRRMLAEWQPLLERLLPDRWLKVGKNVPFPSRDLVKQRFRNCAHHGIHIPNQNTITALAVPVRLRRGFSLPFFWREKLMTGHAGLLLWRLHQPHPAAQMHRHCHQQGQGNLETSKGHDAGLSVGR